jgi:hypothetical protein
MRAEGAVSGPALVVLELAGHAVERYHERVRPGLTLEQAEDDLARQLEAHGHWAEPDWLASDELAHARWLMIGDDIAFPVHGGLVKSCLTRASYGPKERRLATNEAKFDRRARRHRESQAVRRREGRSAKRHGRRDKSWKAEVA